MGAAVIIAGVACHAVSAVIQRPHHHPVARLPARHLRTDRRHHAGAFVSDGAGQGLEPVVIVSVVHMEVRAADSAEGDIHLHLIGLGTLRFIAVQAEGVLSFVHIRVNRNTPVLFEMVFLH
ncbi:hypothetical protein SDC9_117582 [bioreactor metagenome]|uniref:Uncharacterized protein n=1 Tax=bioreactor metagenome TaxID=1076179 RepID=A0A645BZX8_9ZZZZ